MRHGHRFEGFDYDLIDLVSVVIIESSTVSAKEFLTTPGKTIDDYINGLIENYTKKNFLDTEQINVLRTILKKKIEI